MDTNFSGIGYCENHHHCCCDNLGKYLMESTYLCVINGHNGSETEQKYLLNVSNRCTPGRYVHRGAGLHILSAWSARQQQSSCSSAVDTACLQKVVAVLVTDMGHVRCVVTALPHVFSDKCSGTSSHCTHV